MSRLSAELALAGYRWEKAASHPRYFLPYLKAPDSRSGSLFSFATVTQAEADDLEIPFMGKQFNPRGTQRGETSWLWQRDYLDWIIDNPFTVTLKARQLGVSWIWDATILWDLIFFPGVDDLIYSIKEEDAIEQVNRIWDLYLTIPAWMLEMAELTVLKPFGSARPSSRIELEHPDGRVSTVTGMPATKKAGHSRVARRVLFDEGAHQEFARQIWKAIIPAAGDLGGNIGAVSTANGVSDGHGGGNFFHEVYTGAGGVEYPNVKKVFLPWHHHPARTQEWYEGLNLDKQSKAEQYPEDDDEAFLLTGSPFFDLEALQYYSRAARVEPTFQGSWHHYATGPKNRARFRKEEGGSIEVYRKPEDGHEYVIGADVATGEGSDYSVAVVLDCADGAVCAEIRMRADYVVFTRQLHFTAEWYNHALVGVEKGGGFGDTVIAYLRDGHEGRKSYINLYRHRAYDDRKKKLKTTYGFPMTAATRAKVVSELAQWVNQRQLPWVSRRFSVEARTFVRRDARPSPRHADGANDDSVFALGIALEIYSRYGEHPHDVRHKRAAEGFRERSADDPRIALMTTNDPRSA